MLTFFKHSVNLDKTLGSLKSGDWLYYVDYENRNTIYSYMLLVDKVVIGGNYMYFTCTTGNNNVQQTIQIPMEYYSCNSCRLMFVMNDKYYATSYKAIADEMNYHGHKPEPLNDFVVCK